MRICPLAIHLKALTPDPVLPGSLKERICRPSTEKGTSGYSIPPSSLNIPMEDIDYIQFHLPDTRVTPSSSLANILSSQAVPAKTSPRCTMQHTVY
jgi:hypothetical protein